MQYRVYLLNGNNKIAAAESFLAVDDTDAHEIAALLCRSTADACSGYELWHGPRRVTAGSLHEMTGEVSLATLAEERRIRVVELEERLHASFECIRHSRMLLDALTSGRRLGAPGGTSGA